MRRFTYKISTGQKLINIYHRMKKISQERINMEKTNSHRQLTLTLSHWEKYGWTAHTKNLVTRIHFHHPRTLMRKWKNGEFFFGKNGNGNENGNIYVIYDSFLYQNLIHVLVVLPCDIPMSYVLCQVMPDQLFPYLFIWWHLYYTTVYFYQ